VARGAAQAVEPKEEVRRACSVAGLTEEAARRVVTELFSQPRVTQRLHEAPGPFEAGSSFDLVVDQRTGESWNFLEASHRRRCWARLRAEDPWVVIGSPPCTAFSLLNGLNKHRTDPDKQARKLTEGKVLLGFALGVYAWQVRRGKYFVHEHPASASSWALPEVDELRRADGVSIVVCDACVFGMKAVDPDGVERPVLKPTRWMSNAPKLLQALSFRCAGRHGKHTRLLGGRAAAAAVYPPELVVAIVRGLQAQREEDCRAAGVRPPLSAAILEAVTGETARRTSS
jgi:hypothetical protein